MVIPTLGGPTGRSICRPILKFLLLDHVIAASNTLNYRQIRVLGRISKEALEGSAMESRKEIHNEWWRVRRAMGSYSFTFNA